MARVDGVESEQAGLLTRFVYGMVKRKVGRVVAPFKIVAHHPKLFRAVGMMEMFQESAKTIDPALKLLAQVKVATMIGCPF
jgi:alkylhydroperoxidase family enzyme